MTYPLHIILRYELERGLVDGSVAVEDIPRLWNEKMQQYLGATPPNDAKGCLQVLVRVWVWGRGRNSVGAGFQRRLALRGAFGIERAGRGQRRCPVPACSSRPTGIPTRSHSRSVTQLAGPKHTPISPAVVWLPSL